MMQIDENISIEEFRDYAKNWFAENKPNTDELGFRLPLTFMEVGTQEQFDYLCAWQRKVYEAGLIGAAWPKQYGGGGLTQKHQDAATREMAKSRAPILLNAIGNNWAGPLILDLGTDEQKEKYLQKILTAEDVWCQGFSEPENGSDLGNAQLKAVRDGNDYVLNGQKIWTTHGMFAKHMILLARTNQDAPSKYAGLSFMLVPIRDENGETPGIETRPIQKLTGEHGFTETFFTDARVPADGLMGQEGQGWLIAMRTLEYERNARQGQAGGIALTPPDHEAIFNMARQVKRGDVAAIDDPVIRDQLVKLMIEAQSLRLQGQRQHVQPLISDYPISNMLSSKLEQTEYMRRTNEFAIELQGHLGGYYMDEPNAIEDGLFQRGYLNAFSATIGGGTSQIQRNIVGEHVLGLSKG